MSLLKIGGKPFVETNALSLPSRVVDDGDCAMTFFCLIRDECVFWMIPEEAVRVYLALVYVANALPLSFFATFLTVELRGWLINRE